jgi:hypothetical protein
MNDMKDLKYTNKKDQHDLLMKVMAAEEKQAAEEHLEDDPWDAIRDEQRGGRGRGRGRGRGEQTKPNASVIATSTIPKKPKLKIILICLRTITNSG